MSYPVSTDLIVRCSHTKRRTCGPYDNHDRFSQHPDHLKSLGAAHVIDRRLSIETLSAEVTRVLDGQPSEYAMDDVANAEAGHGWARLRGESGEWSLSTLL